MNLKIGIYKTIIFPAVLYGCEIKSHILREKQRLTLLENRILIEYLNPREMRMGSREAFITKKCTACVVHLI